MCTGAKKIMIVASFFFLFIFDSRNMSYTMFKKAYLGDEVQGGWA